MLHFFPSLPSMARTYPCILAAMLFLCFSLVWQVGAIQGSGKRLIRSEKLRMASASSKGNTGDNKEQSSARVTTQAAARAATRGGGDEIGAIASLIRSDRKTRLIRSEKLRRRSASSKGDTATADDRKEGQSFAQVTTQPAARETTQPSDDKMSAILTEHGRIEKGNLVHSSRNKNKGDLWCPPDCTSPSCAGGSPEYGGDHLIDGTCNKICVYLNSGDSVRYCGSGDAYTGASDRVECYDCDDGFEAAPK